MLGGEEEIIDVSTETDVLSPLSDWLAVLTANNTHSQSLSLTLRSKTPVRSPLPPPAPLVRVT